MTRNIQVTATSERLDRPRDPCPCHALDVRAWHILLFSAQCELNYSVRRRAAAVCGSISHASPQHYRQKLTLTHSYSCIAYLSSTMSAVLTPRTHSNVIKRTTMYGLHDRPSTTAEWVSVKSLSNSMCQMKKSWAWCKNNVLWSTSSSNAKPTG